MQDPVWKKAVPVCDFVVFKKNCEPERRTSLRFFHTVRDMFLGFFAEEPEADRVKPSSDSASVWSGDMVELHFGSMGPDPWLMQLALGISGIRFDSAGGYGFWDAGLFETSEGWGAEIRLPLNRLRQTEGGVYFEFCRQSVKRGENSVWSPLFKRYHEVENFGELLFGSYAEIAQLRTGVSFPEEMGRQAFEKARSQWETPANRTIHGPYLSFPEQGSIRVSWETAGRVPGFVEYRRKGSSEIMKTDCAIEGGIRLYESLHSAQLTGLLSGTEYEYRLCTLLPVVEQLSAEPQWHAFRTLPAAGDPFAFFSFSDLHSRAGFLRDALKTPESEHAAFHLSLGDNLSHAAGRMCLFEGVINPFVEANQHRKVEIPLVFVRGNHEELGVFASEYFRVMRHPSGKTWYSFLCGNTMFLALDSMDDKMDSPERLLFVNSEALFKEKFFLKGIVSSPEYKNARFRILLIHIPPLQKHPWVPELIRPLLDADVKTDLMICGHEHRYARINGTAGQISAPEAESSQWAAELSSMPFASVIHSTADVIRFEVADPGISAAVWRRNADGTFSLQDQFLILSQKGKTIPQAPLRKMI